MQFLDNFSGMPFIVSILALTRILTYYENAVHDLVILMLQPSLDSWMNTIPQFWNTLYSTQKNMAKFLKICNKMGLKWRCVANLLYGLMIWSCEFGLNEPCMAKLYGSDVGKKFAVMPENNLYSCAVVCGVWTNNINVLSYIISVWWFPSPPCSAGWDNPSTISI